jgi:radical SAM superfamily enzyme YgiQ (UPF0313 family)
MDDNCQKIKVGWVQIGENYGNSYYLPYSVGILEAYAKAYLKKAEDFDFISPIYMRMPLSQAVEYLSGAHIVFFSVYLWNFRSSLTLAEGLKKEYPNTMIVFGGPQIPEKYEDLEAFLRRYPFINMGCSGEGEIPVLKLLEHYREQRWDLVPSIAYLDQFGNYNRNPMIERIRDLNTIPSPYLEGTFDSLMANNPNISWSSMWETNRGCPFSCAYCAWGSGNKKKVYQYDIKRLFAEIDWFSKKGIEFVFCCDANYGMFGRDLDIVHKVAENKKRFGYPKAFSIQNTKNSTEKIFQLQKVLNDAGLQKGVNLALQSVHGPTLKSIHRANINVDVFRDLQHMFTEEGIATFTDIILGLPEETYETLTEGAASLIENGQHNKIRFINLTLLENTAMAEENYRGRYGLITQESKIIPHHTSVSDDTGCEIETIVVGTRTMPKERWVDTRVFCWMITLLYFNKLLQVPFVMLNRICGVSYRTLTEVFLAENKKYPSLSGIYSFFRLKALAIQQGGPECIAARDWLNIWWPPDEYAFIELNKSGKIKKFYDEVEAALAEFLVRTRLPCPDNLLHEAITLNQYLMKKPFIEDDLVFTQSLNIIDLYRSALVGKDIPLERGSYTYRIDRHSQTWSSWEDWYRDVVWYGTKQGNFLYPVTR